MGEIIVIAIAVLLVVAAAVLLLAAARPGDVRVVRAATIAVPPERIYALINDLRSWAAWSPWEKLDPAMNRTFSGASAGRGAVYEWDGNGKVGAGRMEITEASPSDRIVIKLDFLRPFAGHNTAEFKLDRQGATTKVTWAMHGPQSYVCKLMGLFVSMDRMIGSHFETGLANLKTAAEA